MKTFFQLREKKLEEAVYDVSWGIGVETQVVAATPQEAIKKAKAKILQSKPKLADKKYSDTWEKNPSVHKIRESLEEKAVSKAQQQAAGAALAAKRGEIPVSDLVGASKKMYDNMTEKELEDFAKTKHKGLPDKVGEAVEVSHDRYMRSHGKKASGGEGMWMFTHKRMGDANVNDPKEVHSARGKFSDAKKSAQQWAKKHGHSTVYVMEEVELDEVSDKKLDAYRQKAFADQPAGDDGSDKYRKRKFGRDLAFAKQTGRAKVLATKEEFELDEAKNNLVARYMNKSGSNTLYVEIYEKPNGNYTHTITNQHGINISASSIDLKSSHADAKKNVDKVTRYYDQDGDAGALRFLNSLLPGWKKAPMKESVELDESWGDKIPKSERPGWVKDPKTGKWVKPTWVKKEEVDLSESHFEVGDKVKCTASGMKGKVVEVDPEEKGKYYTVKRDDGKMMKYAPDELKSINESVRLNEDPWEEIPMMERQLAYIQYAAEEIEEYLTDCDEMCVDPEEWFQNKLAHIHGQMQSLHAYIEGDERVRSGMDDEEDEMMEEAELDESMSADHKKLAYDVHKQLKRDEPMGLASGMKLKANHKMLRSKYGSDWRKKAGIKEEVELDEVSTEKLRDYASAALQDKNKAKADKRWKYAGKAMDKVADREVKATHSRKYNKIESIQLRRKKDK